MANPSLGANSAISATLLDTQYFAVAVRLTISGSEAQFVIEIPSSIGAITVTGGSAHPVSTAPGASSFDDTDPSLPGPSQLASATVVVEDDTPAAGRRTVRFTVNANDGSVRWWLVEADNAPGGQTSFSVVNEVTADIGYVLGDPRVIMTTAPATVFESDLLDDSPGADLIVRGTVEHSRFTVAGAPSVPSTGPTALPNLQGAWEQVAPINVATGLPFMPMTPDATTHYVPIPPTFRAPIVVAATELTFRLNGSYLRSGTTLASNGADYLLTVQPRPRNMLLVVDRTGSMSRVMTGTTSNFEFARQAAHIWADLWVAFRASFSGSSGDLTATPVVPGDRVGIMIFDSLNSSWGAPANGPAIQIPPGGLTDVGSFWDLIDTTSIDLLNPRNCTPIGDALLAAVDAFGAPAGPERYTVLLMTDGYENCGEVVVNPANAPAGTPALSGRINASPSRLQVANRTTLHSVGLGSLIDDSTMNQLPQMVSPIPGGKEDGLHGLYRKVQTPDQLMAAFADMTLSTLGANRVGDVVAPPDGSPASDTLHAQYFPVSANEQRLAIAVRWDAGSTNNQIRLAYGPQAGGPFTLLTGSEDYVAFPSSRDTHGIVIVDLTKFPSNGTPMYWRVQHVGQPSGAPGPAAQPLANQALCIVDLFVRADFALDRRDYRIGEPMKITCSLRAGTQPIKGATVRVALDQPGVGLGTFLATNGGGYVQRPMPTKLRLPNVDDVSSHATHLARTGIADPLHPKMAMFSQLLEAKEMEDLPIERPAAIFTDGTDRLYDDGAHGDGAPDDGLYANTFANTLKEGTYTWRFVATGKLPDGSVFSRTFTVSTWVGVKVDPARSLVTLTFNVPAPAGYLGAVIDVLPRSSNGEYLGPFRTGDISFTTTAGTLQGEIESTPDGHYRQVIHYKPEEVPVVTVHGQGEPFPPTVVTTNPLCKCLHELPGLSERLGKQAERLIKEMMRRICTCGSPASPRCTCVSGGTPSTPGDCRGLPSRLTSLIGRLRRHCQ